MSFYLKQYKNNSRGGNENLYIYRIEEKNEI